MYAIFEDGSRQYIVNEGDVVRVDYRDVDEGSTIEFNRVLLVGVSDDDVQIGQPVVEGARVVAEVIEHGSDKVYIQKFRRRKNYRRLKGHRLPFTLVGIDSILLPGQQPRPKETDPSPAPAGESEPADEKKD